MALEQKLCASTYLSGLLRKSRYSDLIQSPADAQRVMLEVIARAEALVGYEDVEVSLRESKIDFTLAWSIAELTGQLSQPELGALQAKFADASIASALRAAWRAPAISKLVKGLPDPSENVPGLFVLGLGKLGGNDLNFSSDVDLISYFEPDKVPVHPMQGKADVCTRILKEMTRLLSDPTDLGFVWRVDWRLRPDASINPLAISSVVAEEYYFFRSMPWHRLALMKARVVGGDVLTGQDFLNRIQPYIWRANLDYRAIDELAAIKRQINQEHPRLKSQRQARTPIELDCTGVNLKLGSGGIREVEFIVNALQLIWGGKKPNLRLHNTLQALKELQVENLLASELAQQLEQAYSFLRRYENYLQMLTNSQAYEIPANPDSYQKFLLLAGIDSEQFREQLYRHRKLVDQQFSQLFYEEDEAESRQASNWPADLSESSRRIVMGWEEGFLLYGATRSQSLQLRALVPELAKRILDSSASADAAIQKVDRFFRKLPPGGQYFRLLLESPRMLDALIEPLIHSPLMTRLLEQSPHIIDGLLEDQSAINTDEIDDQADFVLHSTDQETRLERIRRVLNEELYRICLDFLLGRIDSRKFEHLHSQLAEKMLDLSLRITCDIMGLEQSPIAVLAMGKLGMRAMAPESDIDLVFVCESNEKLDQANRFAHKLQTVMGAKMREGRLFELDTRLRPSGRSGPPTITVESFRNYQMDTARTWEHLALVPARVVAGNEEVGRQVSEIRKQVLRRPRDKTQLINDSVRMLLRLRAEKILDDDAETEADGFQVKLRQGGLMETEYLVAVRFLEIASDQRKLVDLSYDGATELVGNLLYPDLLRILMFWRSLQLWARLLGLKSGLESEVGTAYQKMVLDDIGLEGFDLLPELVASSASGVKAQLDAICEQATFDPRKPDDWSETNIKWTDT